MVPLFSPFFSFQEATLRFSQHLLSQCITDHTIYFLYHGFSNLVMFDLGIYSMLSYLVTKLICNYRNLGFLTILKFFESSYPVIDLLFFLPFFPIWAPGLRHSGNIDLNWMIAYVLIDTVENTTSMCWRSYQW